MSNIVRSGFTPTNLTEAMTFSQMLAKSTMVPKAYQGRPEDILVAVQWGAELGLAPMQTLQNVAVINGKPSIYGDAALALVQNSAVCEDIEETMEGEGTQNPVAVCVAKRKGRKPVVSRFSVEDAKRAGLWGKQGPWTQYPKRMLQMRARGFAIRDAFPDVLRGLITAEEAQDYPSEAPIVSMTRIEAQDDVPALSLEVKESRFPLYLPGGDVYSGHETADDFITAYGNMVQKIRSAKRFSDEEKTLKISDLREANQATRAKLDPIQTLRLNGACADRSNAAVQQNDSADGGNDSPKQAASDLELNAQPS